MRFLGNIEAKADSKGRVFLPAVFRKEIQQAEEVRLVMRKDVFEDCLVLFPESVWNQRLDALRQRLSEWNAVHQRVYRQYVSGVEIVTLDANGRFLIPKRYMQMAGINQDVMFIGMGDTIEIWSREKTATPFVEPADFRSQLEQLMG